MPKLGWRILGLVMAGAIALVLLLVAARTVDGWFGGTADAATTAQSNAAIALHGSLVKIRAHLQTVEVAKAAAGRRTVRWADSARRIQTSPLTHSDTVWMAIADSTRVGAAACFIALAACQQRAESAELEAARLTTQLHAQVGVRHHPCGVTLGLGSTVGVTTAGGLGAAAGLTVLVGCQLVRSPWP